MYYSQPTIVSPLGVGGPAPLTCAGTLKTIYDLLLFASFARLTPQEQT